MLAKIDPFDNLLRRYSHPMRRLEEAGEKLTGGTGLGTHCADEIVDAPG